MRYWKSHLKLLSQLPQIHVNLIGIITIMDKIGYVIAMKV